MLNGGSGIMFEDTLCFSRLTTASCSHSYSILKTVYTFLTVFYLARQ